MVDIKLVKQNNITSVFTSKTPRFLGIPIIRTNRNWFKLEMFGKSGDANDIIEQIKTACIHGSIWMDSRRSKAHISTSSHYNEICEFIIEEI